MDRIAELRRHIPAGSRGIEIAPYFNPIVPKSQGFDVLIVDVFDTERLRSHAAADPLIPDSRIAEIEPVDIVGDASNLGEHIQRLGLAGQMDFIVSSHNFEHLPNPIRFLQGCGTALRPGGVLTMAIPDYRACFDHYRKPTRLSDWLRAYHEGKSQPSPADIFDFESGFANFVTGDVKRGAIYVEHEDPAGFVFENGFREAYDAYQGRLKAPAEYFDMHCSTLFAELFELLVLELRYLGLIDLDVLSVIKTQEFFVHMGKAPAGRDPLPVAVFDARRLALTRVINANLGAALFSNRDAARAAVSRQAEDTRRTEEAKLAANAKLAEDSKRVEEAKRTAQRKRKRAAARKKAQPASPFKAAVARILGRKTTERIRKWRRARKAGNRAA